ncbi:MAG: ParB/RepB/Spo0J family partition protein [Deltaproteobacteria bacterium]|jgi:hypothetical protein|nr:ParB/RepB/Spo0J family partition protein [Deltaproteobacteria bacterium]
MPLSPYPVDTGGQDGWQGQILEIPLAGLAAAPLSHGRPLEDLVKSIGELGLLRPLWLALDGDGRPLVISGGRRLAALARLGFRKAPCLAPRPGPGQTLACSSFLAALALTDNLGRGLNQAELCLAWDWARKASEPPAWPTLAGLLGFRPGTTRLVALEKAMEVQGQTLDLMAQGRLDPENAALLAAWTPEERALALDLVARTGPSRQNRRQWLEWLDDLRRSGGPGFLAGLLAGPALAAISGPRAEKSAREAIHGLRFPFLSDLARRRREALRDLALPEGLKIELDPDFEDVTTTIGLTFSDKDSLGRLAQKALELSEGQALDALWLLED